MPILTEGAPLKLHVAAVILFVVLAFVAVVAVVNAQGAPPKIRASSATLPEHWVQGRGDQGWQWKWRVWLPDKWQRIGACETGYGRRPGNWTWNSGTYQGAFGFHYQSWDQFKPVSWWPHAAYLASPWQQYRTALAIHARYGFSGWGCRGA
jgi:hypothetical protein